LIWLRVGAGSYECGNEPLGFIKLGNFLISWGPVSFLGRTLLHGMRVSFIVNDVAQPQPLLSAWISAACAMLAAPTRVGNIRWKYYNRNNIITKINLHRQINRAVNFILFAALFPLVAMFAIM
jgi:hypothetical protein